MPAYFNKESDGGKDRSRNCPRKPMADLIANVLGTVSRKSPSMCEPYMGGGGFYQ